MKSNKKAIYIQLIQKFVIPALSNKWKTVHLKNTGNKKPEKPIIWKNCLKNLIWKPVHLNCSKQFLFDWLRIVKDWHLIL